MDILDFDCNLGCLHLMDILGFDYNPSSNYNPGFDYNLGPNRSHSHSYLSSIICLSSSSTDLIIHLLQTDRSWYYLHNHLSSGYIVVASSSLSLNCDCILLTLWILYLIEYKVLLINNEKHILNNGQYTK